MAKSKPDGPAAPAQSLSAAYQVQDCGRIELAGRLAIQLNQLTTSQASAATAKSIAKISTNSRPNLRSFDEFSSDRMSVRCESASVPFS
jgi:hypothetical protein